MRQFPTEILHQIMLLLNQEQKVECMRTCSKWHRLINKLSLFDTIRVSSKEALERLIRKIQQEPHQGLKVQRLIIDFSIDTTFDMAMFPTLFPNLRLFYAWSWSVSQSSEEMFLDPWCKQIEIVGEQVTSSFTKRLLTSSVCTNLKELSLTLHNDEMECLLLLANAPNVTLLILSSFKFKLESLEVLHLKLHSLRTLKLKYGSLSNSEMPSEIKPAPSVLSISAYQLRTTRTETYMNFLQYIRQKYINISDISLNSIWPPHYEPQMNVIHDQGWIPLYHQLGSRLSTLRLEPDGVPNNIFDILDEANCKIRHLYLKEECMRYVKEDFKRSNQRKFIETLVLEFQGRGVAGFYWLSYLEKLRSLKVIFSTLPKEDKMINDILDHCPSTLESLFIENNRLYFDFTTLRQYSIKNLTLKNVRLPCGMDTVLSLYFSQLNRLKLESCEFYGNFFVLQNLDLHYLDIISRIPDENRSIMVKTLGDQKQYLYIPRHKVNYYGISKEKLNIHDATVYPLVKALSMDKISTKSEPFLTIVCNTIKNLTIIEKR